MVGVMTIAATLVGWTVTPLFIKHFTHSIDIWTSNGWRYGMAAMMWSPLLIVGWRRRSLPKGLWVAALVPSVINSAAQVCFTMAHYKIDPGLLSFGLRSQIVFVTIGAAALFAAERRIIRSRWFIAGLGLVVVGTVGTVMFGEGMTEPATIAGVLLAVAAGAGFACYALAVRLFMQKIPSMTAFAAISLYTAMTQVGLMLVLGKDRGAGALDLGAEQFALLAASALIGIAAGHVLYYISIRRLGVAVSSGVIQLQPFTVGVLSAIWFGEVLTAGQWASGTVAVAGAVLMLSVQHLIRDKGGVGVSSPAEFADLPPDAVAASAADEALERGE